MKSLCLSSLSLLFALGCSGGVFPPISSGDDPEATAPGDEPADPVASECPLEILSLDQASLGALALVDEDTLFIVGDPNSGSPWQLAEVDLPSATLTPVIDVQSSWTYNDWIEVDGDEVSVFEFYPGYQKHVFNRVTRETFTAPADTERWGGTQVRDGTVYSVHIGNSDNDDDDCGNVCLVRYDEDGGPLTILLDDAEHDFAIHSGSVYFIDDWFYFMTYQNVFSTPGPNAFRRLPLDGGEMEVVFTFEGSHVNAWVHEPVASPSGVVYWLRYQQETFEQPFLTFIDRHDPSTGETEAGFISGVGRDARALTLHADAEQDLHLVWSDVEGLRKAKAVPGALPETLVELPDSAFNFLFFSLVGERLFYSATLGDPAGSSASSGTLGCVSLAP